MSLCTWKSVVAGPLTFAVLSFAPAALSAPNAGAPTQVASDLFRRLTGVRLAVHDPRRAEMEKLIAEGRLKEAAHIATQDDNFINTTLVEFAAPMSNRAESVISEMNDFILIILGTVRDHRDFREVLYANARYDLEGAQPHAVPETPVNYRQAMKRVEPQNDDVKDGAGVLTSNQWANEHLYMGTNRRGIEYSFREFLCTPVSSLADGTVPDNFVRRDVDRRPGGDSRTYENKCRRCHGGLDALGGAYAYFASDRTKLVWDDHVQRKMNQNGDVYAAGRVTSDDAWVNLWTGGSNAALGWRGTLQGRGISQFGKMLSNSRQFSRCMVQRVFSEICRRAPQADDQTVTERLANDFETGGYHLDQLFEDVAVSPRCVLAQTRGAR